MRLNTETPMKWKQAEYRTAIRSIVPPYHKWGTEGGFVSGPFGIHMTIHEWCLTHLPTGRLFCRTSSLRNAKRAAAEFAAITDWSKIKTVKAHLAQPRRILRAAARVHDKYANKGVLK